MNKIKCLADRDGFKKGSEYPVLAFGTTAVMVRDEDKKIVGVGYALVNDEKSWEVSIGDEKQDKKPSYTMTETNTGETK